MHGFNLELQLERARPESMGVSKLQHQAQDWILTVLQDMYLLDASIANGTTPTRSKV